MKKFSVVNFVLEKKVAVVSTSWLNEDLTKCAWPTGPGDHLKNSVQPKKSWTTYPCIHLKFAGKNFL